MNSYQTANAAFAAAGLRPSEGVKHGRGYFFHHALMKAAVNASFASLEARVIGHMAFDLTNTQERPYGSPTGRLGGIAAAKAGGTSWLQPKLRFIVRYREVDDDNGGFETMPWKVYDSTLGVSGIEGRISCFTREDAEETAGRLNKETAP